MIEKGVDGDGRKFYKIYYEQEGWFCWTRYYGLGARGNFDDMVMNDVAMQWFWGVEVIEWCME
jgi:hypothetical protein